MAAMTATTAPDLTPIDPLTDAMSEQTAPALANLIEQVRAMVDQADSLESLRDALLSGYGALDSAELARVMALGFSVADLAGRFDINADAVDSQANA